MDFVRAGKLLASSTYRELGLRAKEYLHYQDNASSEEQYLAEVTMYNCMVTFLKDKEISDLLNKKFHDGVSESDVKQDACNFAPCFACEGIGKEKGNGQ